jgi:PadR family transcriptional regulator, regulatory protein PadR
VTKGAYLGEFEFYVMLAIHHLGADAYGVTIRQAIEDRTGRTVVMGVVYATLGRLAAKGLVVPTLSAPLPVRGGRSRKLYHLSPAGRRVLTESAKMLRGMLRGTRLGVAGADA